ncbi:MAG TPA: GntR family transcriptional regulator [Acidimicrobiia bacterium]|nr:GntR family transcriptional regulator [Acidimicrobiia bacterium]
MTVTSPGWDKPSKSQIHEELRERIILLDLPPGSRLREEHLAAEFGLSRTPIRRVLAQLEFEGLVESIEGAGARVSAIDMKAMRDVWAVRLKIGELVGDFVRLPASEAALAEVRAIRVDLAAVRESRSYRDLGAAYNRFHEAMLSVVDNVALTRIHDLLYVQTARIWMQFLPEMSLDTEIEIMADEVEQTLEALEGESGRKLAEIRTSHMRMLLDRFNQHVTRMPND